MFGNYLIGLREGLEASLVVSILIAYLVKVGRRDRLVPVGLGVGGAVVLSVSFGALLTYTSSSILQTGQSRELFGGTLSIVSVGFVTWMIFWMRRTARGMRSELSGALENALELGVIAVAATAFIAVAREGLETALFFWSAVQAAGSTLSPILGFVLGLVTSIVIAWLLYRRSVSLTSRGSSRGRARGSWSSRQACWRTASTTFKRAAHLAGWTRSRSTSRPRCHRAAGTARC